MRDCDRVCFGFGTAGAAPALSLENFRLAGTFQDSQRADSTLGGVAMVCALARGIAVTLRGASGGVLFLAATLGLMCLARFIDHRRELAPFFRPLAQIGSAVVPDAGGSRDAVFSSSVVGIFAQCLFVILFVNAFNFRDGVDGWAAGIPAVIPLGHALIPGAALSAKPEYVVGGPLVVTVPDGLRQRTATSGWLCHG